MNRLSDILDGVCCGRTAFVGVGNHERGDDGVGVTVARRLAHLGVPHVFEGGTTPERLVGAVRDGGFETVVLIDAVDAGCEPGAVVVMDAAQVRSRYPQVSTHKISLGTIAQVLLGSTCRRVWLVGIQPESVALGICGLSAAVELSVALVTDYFTSAATGAPVAVEEHTCL
jgi:hydrogenase maturation protease